MWAALINKFLRFRPILQFYVYSLMICGTLSILLLNDKGINLFQFLFTLKRVLMKQMQIRQKEAF